MLLRHCFSSSSSSSSSPSSSSSSSGRRGNINLPYYAGITEPLAGILKSKGFTTSITSRGSLRETLVKPKDKLPKAELTGVVYHIPCAGANSTPCPGRYVGETERTAQARFQDHTSTSSNALGKYKSAMLQHARENGHHFRKEDVTILSSEQDWTRRGIKEALYIKTLAPSINIDAGRHHLSDHFDAILSSIIRPPPSPPPHDPAKEQLINTAPRKPGRPKTQTLSQPSTSRTREQTSPLSQRPLTQPLRQSQRLRERQTSHSVS